MNNRERIFIRPSRDTIVIFWQWVGIVFAAFLATYFSANHLASQHTDRFKMFTEWELTIPLVPWMIVVYLSYVAVFLVLPFVLKSSQALVSLAYSFLAGTFVSTVIFVLFPGELGYERAEFVVGFDFLFQTLYHVDHPHNLYPSLHVTFSSLTAMAMIHQTQARWFHLAVVGWAIVIAASVILIHQHHLFDVLTGAILAVCCYRWVYLRYVDRMKTA